MTEEEIQKRLDEIAAKMLAKGLRAPDAVVHIKSNAEVSAGGSWKDESRTYGDDYHYVRGDNVTEALDAFAEFVADMPDAQQRKLNDFMALVGKAIDLGRETGIDAEFVNPLSVLMKRLADNALTFQKAGA